jgi:sugar-phosphatase
MCEAAMGLRISEVIEHWYHQYPWPNPDFKELERTILQRVSHRITSRGTLMRGVPEVLHIFLQRSVPMALASASPMILIDTFLDKFNLHSFFKVVHSAEQEAFGKPHPAVFLTTAMMMNIHPTRVLVFEDSFNGMIAAKAARMKVAVVPDPKQQNQPRWIIADRQLSSLSDWDEDLWKIINQ